MPKWILANRRREQQVGAPTLDRFGLILGMIIHHSRVTLPPSERSAIGQFHSIGTRLAYPHRSSPREHLIKASGIQIRRHPCYRGPVSSLRRRSNQRTPSFLPPTWGRSLVGKALEEVLFMRDEMANMVWAVERTIEVPLAVRSISRRPTSRSPDRELPTSWGERESHQAV